MSTPHPLATSVKVLLLLAGTAATVNAQNILYQAPTGPDGSWNLYEFVTTGANFKDAHNASNGIANPLGGDELGFLADIQSAFENTAINQMTYRADAWIGLTDRVGVAPGATAEGVFGWTNGAPLAYINNNPGEPNNAGGEDAVHISGGGGWNDNKSGFGLNDPASPDNTDESGGPSFRYIRKWSTESTTPLPNIRSAAALSFDGSVSEFAPAPTPGFFGVREVRGLTLAGNLYDTVNKVLSGAGTHFEAQRARLDTADPDTNVNGGPVLSTAPLPYISDTPGTADDNIITVANGQIVVPSSGEYTLQVRGDDGFALRVVGQEFTSVNGSGQIDPLDASTIMFYGGTGDSNTRGIISLEAGTYDLEFVHWEGGGGAYYEVTSAKGAFNQVGGIQWLPLGDGSVLQAQNHILTLTEDAAVHTAGENAGGTTLTANSIAEARALIDAARTANALNSGTRRFLRIGDGQLDPFPAGTPADEFATQLLGSFLLDDGDGIAGETLTITFGIFSDDGSQLRILGSDFYNPKTFATDAGAAATLVDIGGDMALTADFFTGNTNTFGAIDLTEGTHQFEAFMFEGTGGANMSIQWALGDKTATGLDAEFVPLARPVAANEGLAVVPEPSTALLGLIGTSLLALRRRRR